MLKEIDSLKKILNDEEILTHFFLNCSSYKKNDIIFLLKKEISKEFEIDIKDIKLIGSGHTGFYLNKLNNKLERRKNIKDYDFIIIDTNFFNKILTEIVDKDYYSTFQYRGIIDRPPKDIFERNLRKGKIHLRYVDKKFRVICYFKSLEKMLEKRFNMTLKVSCCIYKTEKDFLKYLYSYYLKSLENFKSLLDEKTPLNIDWLYLKIAINIIKNKLIKYHKIKYW